MTKAELVAQLAVCCDLPQATVEKVINEFINQVPKIVRGLKEGEGITLVRLGTFGKRKRNARICRNPQTGEKFQVGASTVPVFKMGRRFKEIVNLKF